MATEATYMATGATYVETWATYMATGATYMATGATYMATGANYMATEATYMATGATYMTTGATYMATGATYMFDMSFGSSFSALRSVHGVTKSARRIFVHKKDKIMGEWIKLHNLSFLICILHPPLLVRLYESVWDGWGLWRHEKYMKNSVKNMTGWVSRGEIWTQMRCY